MADDEAYGAVKASLMKADTTGKGHIARDVLIKILEKVADLTLTSPDLERFVSSTFGQEHVPIAAFLDFIFQRFPGLKGAQDVDLSAVFQCIDKNRNGFLEKHEVVAAANSADSELVHLCQQIPSLQPFLSVEKWEKHFLDMDTNEDGKISWFEFVRFFLNAGACEAQASEDADLVAVFVCIDKNRNGSLEKAEVLAAVNSDDSGIQEICNQIPALLPLLKKDSWQAAFENLDTNADGMISWHEFSTFFKNVCKNPMRV
jgi:Ca2+-binding EF-hand superfamily protein